MGQGQSSVQPFHPPAERPNRPSRAEPARQQEPDPPYQIDGGRFMPLTNIYPNAAQDYDHATVHKLINSRRLAPFYRGIEDIDPNNNQELDEALDSVGSKSRTSDPPLERERERQIYQATDSLGECPICFLNYPNFMNYSRCCDHAICTECFVFIKRPEPSPNSLTSEAVACPFCVEPNFGIIYYSPPEHVRHGGLPSSSSSSNGTSTSTSASTLSSAQSSNNPDSSSSTNQQQQSEQATVDTPHRKSVAVDDPQVVTIDMVRPDWQDKLNAAKASAARRANRRIVFRQVGDRVIPIGVTSGREGNSLRSGGSSSSSSNSPFILGSTLNSSSSSSSSPSSERRTRRRASEWGISGADLEELMILEAMRLSRIEEEERQKRVREETQQQSSEASANQTNDSSTTTTTTNSTNTNNNNNNNNNNNEPSITNDSPLIDRQHSNSSSSQEGTGSNGSNNGNHKHRKKLSGAVRGFWHNHHLGPSSSSSSSSSSSNNNNNNTSATRASQSVTTAPASVAAAIALPPSGPSSIAGSPRTSSIPPQFAQRPPSPQQTTSDPAHDPAATPTPGSPIHTRGISLEPSPQSTPEPSPKPNLVSLPQVAMSSNSLHITPPPPPTSSSSSSKEQDQKQENNKTITNTLTTTSGATSEQSTSLTAEPQVSLPPHRYSGSIRSSTQDSMASSFTGSTTGLDSYVPIPSDDGINRVPSDIDSQSLIPGPASSSIRSGTSALLGGDNSSIGDGSIDNDYSFKIDDDLDLQQRPVSNEGKQPTTTITSSSPPSSSPQSSPPPVTSASISSPQETNSSSSSSSSSSPTVPIPLSSSNESTTTTDEPQERSSNAFVRSSSLLQ